MKTLRILDQAVEELDEAVSYYNSFRPGKGDELRDAVARKIRRIHAFPRMGNPVPKSSYRKSFVREFPYVVVFFEDVDCICIVAVSHTSRDPDYWKTRL